MLCVERSVSCGTATDEDDLRVIDRQAEHLWVSRGEYLRWVTKSIARRGTVQATGEDLLRSVDLARCTLRHVGNQDFDLITDVTGQPVERLSGTPSTSWPCASQRAYRTRLPGQW